MLARGFLGVSLMCCVGVGFVLMCCVVDSCVVVYVWGGVVWCNWGVWVGGGGGGWVGGGGGGGGVGGGGRGVAALAGCSSGGVHEM